MKYKEVPNIITGKDLDYLNDAFNWNYNAYKNFIEAYDNLSDESLQKEVKDASNELYENMKEIIDIIEGGIDENSKY